MLLIQSKLHTVNILRYSVGKHSYQNLPFGLAGVVTWKHVWFQELLGENVLTSSSLRASTRDLVLVCSCSFHFSWRWRNVLMARAQLLDVYGITVMRLPAFLLQCFVFLLLHCIVWQDQWDPSTPMLCSHHILDLKEPHCIRIINKTLLQCVQWDCGVFL